MNKIDDLYRSVDGIAHDVENLKIEKAFSSDFFRKSDEDHKMIDVSSIYYLFNKVNIDEKGIG